MIAQDRAPRTRGRRRCRRRAGAGVRGRRRTPACRAGTRESARPGLWDFECVLGVRHRSPALVVAIVHRAPTYFSTRASRYPDRPGLPSARLASGRRSFARCSCRHLANAVKPVSVDDTAYLAFARHIAATPARPVRFHDLLVHQSRSGDESSRAAGRAVLARARDSTLRRAHPRCSKLWLFPFVWLFAWSVRDLLRRFARGTEYLLPRDRALAGGASRCEPDARRPGAGARPRGGCALRSRRGSRLVAARTGRRGSARGAGDADEVHDARDPAGRLCGMGSRTARSASRLSRWPSRWSRSPGGNYSWSQKYGRSHFVHHAASQTVDAHGPARTGSLRFVRVKIDLARPLAGSPGMSRHRSRAGRGSARGSVAALARGRGRSVGRRVSC